MKKVIMALPGFIMFCEQNDKASCYWGGLAAVSVIFALVIIFLLLRIKKIRKESEIDKMTDFETGLGNLHSFTYNFTHTISDDLRNRYYIAYIIFDRSYLRSYYRRYSFDYVLRYAASVLLENTKEKEFSSRITESGFAFLFKAEDENGSKQRLNEIMNKINSFEESKEKSKNLVFHSAVYHLTEADKNCEILLFNLRKNCSGIFGTEKQIIYCDTHLMNSIQEEKNIAESILKGLENNEFKMYLQLIVDNKTKKFVSAEALSRWDSKEGLLGPGRYIPDMEWSGLISRHDFYMFLLACSQLEKWKSTPLENISISCNFTRITLSEKDFIENLTKIADKFDFDRNKLSIEITEDAIEKDREIATENVIRAKELGFKIYLDDLGSGYTTFANLCDYPIDVVKIDRDILLKADTERGKDLFSGIVALAHNLNMEVVCEGVETEEQNEFVSSSECDFIQGWYYHKPMSVEECEKLILE